MTEDDWMSPPETKDARLARLTSDLALSLALRSNQGDSTAALAEITGLPPGVVAGLITIGRKGLR